MSPHTDTLFRQPVNQHFCLLNNYARLVEFILKTIYISWVGTSGVRTAYPFGAPQFNPGVQWSLCCFCVVFFKSLFVHLSFFLWPLCYLSFFGLRITDSDYSFVIFKLFSTRPEIGFTIYHTPGIATQKVVRVLDLSLMHVTRTLYYVRLQERQWVNNNPHLAVLVDISCRSVGFTKVTRSNTMAEIFQR